MYNVGYYTRSDRTWGPLTLLYNAYWVSFSGVNPAGRGVDEPSHLASRIRKE